MEAKLVQIILVKDTLYALDNEGRLWFYQKKDQANGSPWNRIPGPIINTETTK